jgi:hypothetical protein
MLRKRLLARTAVLFLLLGLPALVTALEVDWFTIDGGGGASTAGFLSLTGTIAQVDAGPMSGGTFGLRGGFWAAAGETATDVPGGGPGQISPVRHRLHANSPNPFRTQTALRFDLPRRERARIRVFDVTGRLVETLVDGELEPGSHEVRWDGRDRGGQRVASGVYLVRMQAGSFGATRKITRLD